MLQSPIDNVSTTEALGIHQSDIIIRTALITGLAHLRSEPWLLDKVFASLPRDALTAAQYGEKELQNAKNWFLQTEIPVFMDYRPDTAKLPCLSIELTESAEAENTLGDTHYVPYEEEEATWPVLYGPFKPVSYNLTTGVMVLPDAITDTVFLNTQMYVVDRVGNSYPILEAIDQVTVRIDPSIPADFSLVTVRSTKPILITSLESLAFKETYRIGCHSIGEPIYLTYLHSITVFILLAFKQDLLEARSFERSTISSSDFVRNNNLDAELAYSRFISITGYVRNYWPKVTTLRIQGTVLDKLKYSAVGDMPTEFVGDPNDDDNLWYAQLGDGIGVNANKGK